MVFKFKLLPLLLLNALFFNCSSNDSSTNDPVVPPSDPVCRTIGETGREYTTMFKP